MTTWKAVGQYHEKENRKGAFQRMIGKIIRDVGYKNFKIYMESLKREILEIDLRNPSILNSLGYKISNYFYDKKLNKSCYSCLMDSINYISSNQEYWDAIPFKSRPEFQVALRQVGVLFALFGEEPQTCKHQKGFAQWKVKSLATKVSILITMMNNLNYLRKNISNSSSVGNLNNSQLKLIQTADEISRNSPTAVRFPWVSRIISQHLIENLTLFYPLKRELNNFNEVFQDIADWTLKYPSRAQDHIRSVEDPSWPLLSALSSDLDEIKDRFGSPVTIHDVIEWNDSISIPIYEQHRLIRRGNCVIPIDAHEFAYGLYKTLLEYIEMPAGQEGYLFERIVQELMASLLDGCSLFSGAHIVKKGSGVKFENDFILEVQDNFVLGECKNKKRYNNPAAGVKQSEEHIKNEAHKQLMEQSCALLDPNSPGYIRLKDGKQCKIVNSISNIFQIVVHSHEYIYPDYKNTKGEELNKASLDTHFFSLEGLVFALHTAMDGNDFLRYLNFRKKYIKFWRYRIACDLLFDEFDICVSYVNGNNGVHPLVSFDCESQREWNVPNKKEWRSFLEYVYRVKSGSNICVDNIRSQPAILVRVTESEKKLGKGNIMYFKFNES